MGQDVVPEEAGWGVGHGVAARVGVAAREAAEGFFEVVGDIGFVGPLVAVGAEDAAAVEVVEQHELFGQLVVVGRDLAAEDAQVGSPSPCFDVAEDLIVGAVLFDDVEDVLEDGRLAVPLGNRARLGVRARRGEGVDRFGQAIVFEDLLRVRGELVGVGSLMSETVPWWSCEL